MGHPGTLPGRGVLICPVGAVKSVVGVTWAGQGGAWGAGWQHRQETPTASTWGGQRRGRLLEEGTGAGKEGEM